MVQKVEVAAFTDVRAYDAGTAAFGTAAIFGRDLYALTLSGRSNGRWSALPAESATISLWRAAFGFLCRPRESPSEVVATTSNRITLDTDRIQEWYYRSLLGA